MLLVLCFALGSLLPLLQEAEVSPYVVLWTVPGSPDELCTGGACSSGGRAGAPRAVLWGQRVPRHGDSVCCALGTLCAMPWGHRVLRPGDSVCRTLGTACAMP